jgi:hypothetical protein
MVTNAVGGIETGTIPEQTKKIFYQHNASRKGKEEHNLLEKTLPKLRGLHSDYPQIVDPQKCLLGQSLSS